MATAADSVTNWVKPLEMESALDWDKSWAMDRAMATDQASAGD
jgi:hypothetical protein